MRNVIIALFAISTFVTVTFAEPPALVSLPGAGSVKRGFDSLAKVEARIVPAEAKPGEVVTFELSVIPNSGAYTYPVNIPEGQIGLNVIKLPPPSDLIFVGDIVDPPGAKSRQSELNPIVTEKYYPHPTRPMWRLTAVVSPDAKPGKKSVPLIGTVLQACDKACYTSKTPPVAELTITDNPAVPVPEQYAKAVSDALAKRGSNTLAPTPPDPVRPAPKVINDPPRVHKGAELTRKAAVPLADYKAELEALRQQMTDNPTVAGPVEGGLKGLLLAAAFWGFVSLVTPCVFPMIPITVSLFLKQSHQSTAGAVKLAIVYCLTIVGVLGAAAVSLLSVFQALSNHPYTNLFLGGLFVVFALSLFGMYDISLPGFMLRYTEKRRGAGGIIGTIFGALAFSIVSFTCVAPFLGGFAGLAASNQFSTAGRALAGLTFAAAFASPFFVLALFPSLLKKLPKSGGWMDSVKVVMGFLELAAALKFLRSAELLSSGRPTYFTYDVVLAGWIVIAVAAGLYAFNVFRLPHDEEKQHVGVGRMLLGILFLGLAIYLTPALFKGNTGQPQRPAGVVYAWVDAFLLPEPAEAGKEGLAWEPDLKVAVDRIAKERQVGGIVTKPLIFVDFTGVNCTNCKLNEQNVFPRVAVRELLEKYTLVQLYADIVPPEVYFSAPLESNRRAEAEANLDFQEAVFGRVSRPMYAILEPQTDGKVRVVGIYDVGTIENVEEFVNFLKKPLDAK